MYYFSVNKLECFADSKIKLTVGMLTNYNAYYKKTLFSYCIAASATLNNIIYKTICRFYDSITSSYNLINYLPILFCAIFFNTQQYQQKRNK